MARATTDTALSLDRYAEIMGISPAHFNGVYGIDVFPVNSNCDSLWYQYDWQNYDQMSRETLARGIAEAEAEIASVLGYWPGPRWFEFDIANFPRHHRPDVISGGVYDVRDYRKGFQLPYGKIIAVGKKKVSVVDSTTTIAYSDADGDTIDELATVTGAISTAFEDIVTDINAGIASSGYTLGHDKIDYTSTAYYHAKWMSLYSADDVVLAGTYNPALRLRDFLYPPYFETAGDTIVFRMPSWSCLKLGTTGMSAYPTANGGPSFLLSNTGNSSWIDNVHVVAEYPDYSQPHATLYWTSDYNCSSCNGSGCSRCAHTEQSACLLVKDPELGLVVPSPATWSATDEVWYASEYTVHRAPDRVQVSYYAGAVSEAWRQGLSHDPMDEQMARAVAYLATARMERPMCGCGNTVALADHMRKDLSIASPDGGFIVVGDDVLRNPFGTKYGEVMAWRIISKLTTRHFGVAVV